MGTWTSAKVEALTEGWTAGRGYAELARDLEVSLSSVRSKRFHLGLPDRSEEALAVVNRANGEAQATGLRAILHRGWAPTGKAKAEAWSALAGSTPRPVEQRMAGECCWPIGAHLESCCLPVARPGSMYCGEHLRLSRGGKDARAH